MERSSNTSLNIFLLLTLIFIFLLSALLYGQDNRSVDKRFEEARELAFSGNRLTAIDSCKSILVEYPDYYEVRIFMARVMAWDKNYDEATKNIKMVLSEKEDDQEALNAIVDVYYWSGDFNSSLTYCNIALDYYSSNPDFLIKKAEALKKLDRTSEAAGVVNQLLNIYPANSEGLKLQEELYKAALLNQISINYKADYFNGATPWHLAYLEYARKFNFGTLFLRTNYGYRFGKGGWLFESDGYINIRNGTYTYLNAGYSGSSIFPKWRVAIEPYQVLPWSFELSLGFKYFEFTNAAVRLYTGSLGYYYGNYWFAYRFYFAPKSLSSNYSSEIYIRRYLFDTDNYLTLRIGIGLVSYSKFEDEQFNGIGSKSAALEFQLLISNLTFLRGEINYGNYEYYKGKYRNNYGFRLGVQQRF